MDIVATSKWSVTGKVVNPKKKKTEAKQTSTAVANRNPWVVPSFLGASALLVLFAYFKNR